MRLEACGELRQLPAGESPAISAVMFAAGALGNVLALALLLRARRRRGGGKGQRGPFHVLLAGLVGTDLLGTCLLSPVVLAAYGRNSSLEALGPRVCGGFGFGMSFFGLATPLLLGALALERCVALARPYLYARLRGRARAGALRALPALYGLALAGAAPPLLGWGRYEQHCPGTWCFVRMRRGGAYPLLYASLLLALVAAVLLCNLGAAAALLRMRHRRPGPPAALAREMDHLVLLAVVTVTFVVCSLPFTVSRGGEGRECPSVGGGRGAGVSRQRSQERCGTLHP